MSRIDRDRRKFLAAGSTAAAISLAGCSSVVLNRLGGDGESEEEQEEDGGGGGGGGGSERGENVPEGVHTYLTETGAGALLYEGEAEDMTGSGEVTVEVGGGDSGLAFDPPAILVDPGTTISWQWTGAGGGHNVVSAEDSATEFRSGNIQQGSDITYTQTFESGNQLYYCNPHKASGMLGAVIVSGGSGGMDG